MLNARHVVLAQRLSQFIGLMTHPGANDPADRRELCLTMMIDLFIGLGLINDSSEVIDRAAYDAFVAEFTSGIQNVLREFGVPEDDIPQWNGIDELFPSDDS